MKFSRLFSLLLAGFIATQPVLAAEQQTSSWRDWAQSALNWTRSAFTVDNVKNTFNNLWERAKQNPKATALIGGAGVGLAVVSLCTWKLIGGKRQQVCAAPVEPGVGNGVGAVPAEQAPQAPQPLSDLQMAVISEVVSKFFNNDYYETSLNYPPFIQTVKDFMKDADKLKNADNFKQFKETLTEQNEDLTNYLRSRLFAQQLASINARLKTARVSTVDSTNPNLFKTARDAITTYIETVIYPNAFMRVGVFSDVLPSQAAFIVRPFQSVFSDERINDYKAIKEDFAQRNKQPYPTFDKNDVKTIVKNYLENAYRDQTVAFINKVTNMVFNVIEANNAQTHAIDTVVAKLNEKTLGQQAGAAASAAASTIQHVATTAVQKAPGAAQAAAQWIKLGVDWAKGQVDTVRKKLQTPQGDLSASEIAGEFELVGAQINDTTLQAIATILFNTYYGNSNNGKFLAEEIDKYLTGKMPNPSNKTPIDLILYTTQLVLTRFTTDSMKNYFEQPENTIIKAQLENDYQSKQKIHEYMKALYSNEIEKKLAEHAQKQAGK